MPQLPNVSPGQVITAAHVNSIKNGLYAWSADVDANDYALTELDRIQINAGTLPGTPTTGTLAIDSGDSNKLKYWNGSAWQVAGGGASGSAGGDLSGTYPNPTIATVGGASASSIATATTATNNAVSTNTASRIVIRDSSGNFAAGQITASSVIGLGHIQINAASLPGSPTTGTVAVDSADGNKLKWWNGSAWQLAGGLSGTVAIANGGTGQTTASAALNALLPSQSGNSGKVLKTDGTNATWQDDATGGGGGGGGIAGPFGSASLNFGSIDDGATAELTFTLSGAAVGDRVAPSWPSSLDAGLVGMMFVSATNTVTVRLLNLSGAAINPASMTFGAQAIQNSYLTGSASLNFGSIDDGATASLTFTVTGATTGDALAPAWPSGLDAGLLGTMYVSAADTVTVRLLNLSGAAINPSSMTFGAQVFQ